jgi:DNA-binding NarL/FixJ family response regulator
MTSKLTLGYKHRILVVDDHPMVRDGIRYQLESHPDLQYVGEADTVVDAMKLLRSEHPNLVIVDITLKSHSGLELIDAIRNYDQSIRILVLTMHDESIYADRCFRSAHGYLNKQDSGDSLILAIRELLNGNRYMSEETSARLISQAIGNHDKSPQTVATLSNRELEVFQLIGDGLSTSQIAQRLCLSPHTIDTHRERIKTKLGLKNGIDLQREAIEWKLRNT